MAEKRFILAKDDEQAKALLKGGTATDNNGKEITAGGNSIVFVPEEKEVFTYFYVVFPENSTTLTIDLSPIQENVTIDWGDGTVNTEKTHTYNDANKIPKVIAVKNIKVLPVNLFSKSIHAESANALIGVKIGESVQRVTGCFLACDNLSFVELPTISNATEFMYFSLAFANCEKLTKIVVPTPYFEFVSAFGMAKEVEFLSPIPPKQLHIGGAGETPITKYIVPRSAVELYKTEFAKISTEHANNVETYAYESEIPEPLYKYTLECYVRSNDARAMDEGLWEDENVLTIFKTLGIFSPIYRHFSIDFYSRTNWGYAIENQRTKIEGNDKQALELFLQGSIVKGKEFIATASGNWIEDFKFKKLVDNEGAELSWINREWEKSNTEIETYKRFLATIADLPAEITNLTWTRGQLSAKAVKMYEVYEETQTGTYSDLRVVIIIDGTVEGQIPLAQVQISNFDVEFESREYDLSTDFSRIFITKNKVL